MIYGLIASHGNMADLVFFAELMEDYEKVISHRLQRNEFNHAIEQLTNKVSTKDRHGSDDCLLT